MTNQPKFKCIANLGDATPWEYGGAFVLVDETGVYTPELRVFEEPVGNKYEERVILLDRCTFVNGILSDNEFHPEHPAWFADCVPDLARYIGVEEDQLYAQFCSDDPIERAWAYLTVVHYHGPQDCPTCHFHKMAVMSRMKKWLREEAKHETA